jgi:hypothetical protein
MAQGTMRLATTIIVAALLSSCQLGARLAIVDGSTAAKLEFVLSEWSNTKPGRLEAIYVFSCVERLGKFPTPTGRVWSAHARKGSDTPEVGRFNYGHATSLTTDFEAQPLKPGCYVARAYAKFPDTRQGFVAFRVTAAGDVVVITDS